MRAVAFAALVLAWGSGAAPAADLRPFVAGSWQDIVKSHAGHSVIVHFWGMTCGPCRVEMPRWGAFLATHPGTAMVTVDTDVVAGAPGAAEAFLASANVPVSDAWRFADPFAEKLYFAVDPGWQGEIPMTLLIGRDGRVTKKLGAVAMPDVDQWLATQR